MSIASPASPHVTHRSAWAICCGTLSITCFLSAAAFVVTAFLPESWVGHPYLRFAQGLNPGIDAPDNWAIATLLYFYRMVSAAIVGGILLLFVGNPRFWPRRLA